MLRSLLREPLVHFLLLGALLFALDAWLRPVPVADAGGEILVSEGRIRTLAQGFRRTWQRPPTRTELDGTDRKFKPLSGSSEVPVCTCSGPEGESRHKQEVRGHRERSESELRDEIARSSGQGSEMGAGAVHDRRRRLPEETLVNLQTGVWLGEEVPVRGRLGRLLPVGRSTGRGDGGGRGGSPLWVRIRSTGAASVTKAMMRLSAPQFGQVSGRDSNSRASRIAQR